MQTRTRLVRIVIEELESSMTPERAREIFVAAIGTDATPDADDLIEKVHGPLRAALATQLGTSHGGLLADRICDMLAVHAPSGIRRRGGGARPEVTVGVVDAGKAARTERLVAGIRSLGMGVVVVSADDGGRIESATIDALLVPSDLPLAEVREITWRNAQRHEPALVVVWPVENVRPALGKALGHPVELPEASFTLLARVLADQVSERVRPSRRGART